jgi:DNA-binding transcriptional ArsR family regulator
MAELNGRDAVTDADTLSLDGHIVGERVAEELAETFHALADPTRVRLISLLVDGERCVGDLASVLEMSISAISHQLALLHRLRIVLRRRQGRHVFYALDDDHIATIYRCGLEHLQHS